VERNIRQDPTAKAELLERTGSLVVPVLFVNDRRVVGWDESRISELLEIAPA
jgi:glutaredoxin